MHVGEMNVVKNERFGLYRSNALLNGFETCFIAFGLKKTILLIYKTLKLDEN